MSGQPRDSGSASLWVLAAGALVLVVGLVGALRCSAVLARHRAESAADLAALAAAGRIGVDGHACQAAAAIAAANRASVDSCQLSVRADGRSGSASVEVSVVFSLPMVGVSRVHARARAVRDPAAG